MSFKKTNKQFIEDAICKHGNLYDYSKVNYVNNKTKVIIICPIHGEFEQKPNGHLNGYACKKCGNLKISNTKKYSTQKFIEKAKKIHKDEYNYTKSIYLGNRNKIKIICNKHGIFKQDPAEHLQGKGCKRCGFIKTSNKNTFKDGFYSLKRAERHKEEWKEKEVILYFVKLTNKEEEFYKIGITTHKEVKHRFNKIKNVYQLDIIKKYITNAYNASVLETIIKEENDQFKYKPKTRFDGHTECFVKNIIK